MSRKHFSWLLIVTFLVAVLVLVVPGKTGRESSVEPVALIPAAAAKINDVDWLRLSSAGGESIATLVRGESGWGVQEASVYPADWGRLKSLLTDLSQAEIIEPKTSNPVYYSRLGVEDLASPGAGGVLVEFSADSGLPALIVGNNAQGREGQYVRLQDVAESALINRRLDLPRETVDWLDGDIIDISDAEVVEYEIIHPDGESVRAVKASADDDNFKLQDIPGGMEIKSEWNVNAPAGAQAGLSLESVRPDNGFDWTAAIRFRLLTADGLLIESELLAIEPAVESGAEEQTSEREHWLRLQAGLYTTAVGSVVETQGDDSVPGERAETINERVKGWVYRIPEYKFDSMAKRKSDLLQSEE